MTEAKLSADKLGAAGKEALRVAHAQAGGGASVKVNEVREQVRVAVTSLQNEQASGRVNDGFVDSRPTALKTAVYTFAASELFTTSNEASIEPTVSASKRQISKAAQTLSGIVDQAVAIQVDEDGLEDALRAAARFEGVGARGTGSFDGHVPPGRPHDGQHQ